MMENTIYSMLEDVYNLQATVSAMKKQTEEKEKRNRSETLEKLKSDNITSEEIKILKLEVEKLKKELKEYRKTEKKVKEISKKRKEKVMDNQIESNEDSLSVGYQEVQKIEIQGIN